MLGHGCSELLPEDEIMQSSVILVRGLIFVIFLR